MNKESLKMLDIDPHSKHNRYLPIQSKERITSELNKRAIHVQKMQKIKKDREKEKHDKL